MEKFKEPTPNMKTTLLDLLSVVQTYDNGKAGLPHDVTGVHHMTLKAMAKPDYGKLILLDASYSTSPTALVWTVAITAYGLRVAKKLAKSKDVIYDTPINASRKLRTINWQVDMTKTEGRQVYEDAKAMKADPKQSFTKTMNQLMKLHKELSVGQVGLLQKLYPEAYTTMLLIARNEIEMESGGDLRGLIDEFKRHILSASQLEPIGVNSGDKLGLRVLQPNEPMDGLKLEIRRDTTSGKESNRNFLKSVVGLLDEEKQWDVDNLQPAPTGIRKLSVAPIAAHDEDIEIEW
jgi:hypothetical protein